MSRSLVEIAESRTTAWSVGELAELLNVSKRGIYALINRGKVPVVRIGTSVRLDPKAVATWIRENSTSN